MDASDDRRAAFEAVPEADRVVWLGRTLLQVRPRPVLRPDRCAMVNSSAAVEQL
jgi:hypothetical protein